MDNYIFNEYNWLYSMTYFELLDYLKKGLDFNDNTYPYINHNEVLTQYTADDLRKFIIEIIEDNENCAIIDGV